MPEHDISDKLAVQLLPSVRVVVGSKLQEVIASAQSQTYGKLSITCIEDEDNVPAFYNRVISETKDKTDIFVFLNDFAWLKDNNSVNLLIESFVKNGFKHPLVYGDSIRVEKNYEVCEFLPGYTPSLLFTNLIMNNTFAVQSKVLPQKPFNEKLEFLYFFDLMRKIGYQHMLHHIAEPIFRVKRITFDLEKEIRALNE